jgi:hypothetical protein
MVGLHARSVPNFGHGHLRYLRKQFRQHSFVVGFQMLYHDKSYPGVQRQGSQEFREGFQSASRSSDAHYRESTSVSVRLASGISRRRGRTFAVNSRGASSGGGWWFRWFFPESPFHRVRTQKALHRGYHA